MRRPSMRNSTGMIPIFDDVSFYSAEPDRQERWLHGVLVLAFGGQAWW